MGEQWAYGRLSNLARDGTTPDQHISYALPGFCNYGTTAFTAAVLTLSLPAESTAVAE
jgi:hypothetical protein